MVDRDDLTYGEYKKSSKDKRREKQSTRKRKEGRRISDRPQKADDRAELGHWEMDLLEGKKGKGEPFLLVLTERLSRKEIIEKIPDKTQESVIKGLDRIERRTGVKEFRKRFKTITTDNGREFYDYEGIETSYTKSSIPRTQHYYADAYCSWQRGSNDNLNKMIRRFIPKGRSLEKYTRKAIKKIQKWMNNYPRKMFDFKTAGEVFQENLQAA
jgi:IS30 family transposase